MQQKEAWQPKNHYSYKLKDIKEQLTPSEQYRHILVTSGKDERILRRLEWRWEKSLVRWTKAAVIIQARQRGISGRVKFHRMRPNLLVMREQRIAIADVKLASSQGNIEHALQILKNVSAMNLHLYILESKISYTLHDFITSETAARKALEIDSMNADARHLLCCALIHKKGRIEDAYEQLNLMINQNTIPADQSKNVFILRAYVSTRLSPPRYQQAVTDFNHLILEEPHDNNLYLKRACAYCGIQDWNSAIADLTHILSFQPKLNHVLAIRARIYCCKREWKLARDDYNNILQRNPADAIAQRGLAEAANPLPGNEVPMIDHSLIE
eukprot:gene9057-18762_t